MTASSPTWPCSMAPSARSSKGMPAARSGPEGLSLDSLMASFLAVRLGLACGIYAPLTRGGIEGSPMRIIKTTAPSQLVLRDRTLWISGVCFAAALVLGYRVLAYHDPAALAISGLLMAGFGLV